MKKLVALLILACVAGATAWFVLEPRPEAPSVVFHTLDDKSIPLEDLRGQVVLVKFWATDCRTCVAQMPFTTEMYETFSPEGFNVIAVAMAHDPEDYVREFTTSRKLPFTVTLDSDGSIARAFDDVRLTPTAFLIDKNGGIIKKYLGNYDKQEFKNTVQKALTG